MPPSFPRPDHDTSHPGLEGLLQKHGLLLVDNKLLVWNPSSADYPKNWSRTQKCLNVTFILLFEALGSSMSTAGTAAADVARFELSISQTLAYFAFTTL